ncbi:MAG TPA: DedA family protein [Kofleriaceae bacterium]|jgi:membrane protein DedA with SNARE-associated domain
MIQTLLDHGLGVCFLWLLVGSLGLPLPEDVAILAAGVLISRGETNPLLAVIVVVIGVLSGDVILFASAKRLGPRAYEKKFFQKLLPPARRQRFEDLYAKHGGKVVFVARHVAGLRAATFVMAGIHQMDTKRFLFWDGLGAAISIPVIMTLGYLGSEHIELVREGIAHVQHYIVAGVAVLIAGYITWRQVKSIRSARKAAKENLPPATPGVPAEHSQPDLPPP